MGPNVVTPKQLKALLWAHYHGWGLQITPEIEPSIFECHPKVHNMLIQQCNPPDLGPGYETIFGLRIKKVYPEFRETEWRILATLDHIELYHGVEPDGILIRPIVLNSIP